MACYRAANCFVSSGSADIVIFQRVAHVSISEKQRPAQVGQVDRAGIRRGKSQRRDLLLDWRDMRPSFSLLLGLMKSLSISGGGSTSATVGNSLSCFCRSMALVR